jgi:hypothetical protein
MSKKDLPQTYVLICEFVLRNPTDYQMVTDHLRHEINDMPRYLEMQVSHLSIEKKEDPK